MLKIGRKRKPLINLRKWGKQVKLNRNTTLNEKPAEEEFTFTPPINEPPSPVCTPAFSPLGESEDEGLDEAVTTHTTMEVKTIDTVRSQLLNNKFSGMHIIRSITPT